MAVYSYVGMCVLMPVRMLIIYFLLLYISIGADSQAILLHAVCEIFLKN